MTSQAEDNVAQTMHETAALLDHVAKTLNETRSEVHIVSDLAERVRRTSVLNSILMALVIIVALLTVIVVVEVRRDISTNQRVIDTIRECTEPGYECFDKGQLRSNERLAPIISALCEAVPNERRKPPCVPTSTPR